MTARTAIVTGASRGSAGRWPTTWPPTAGPSSSTPATPTDLDAVAAELGAVAGASPPSPATSPTPPTAGAGRGRRLGRPRPAGQQRQHPRAPPRCPAWPTYRLADLGATRVGTNVVAPLGAGPARPCRPCAPPAATSSTSPPTPPSRATRAGAATASSKAALEQLGHVLAAEEPDVRVYCGRPGRHAHPDAPGRLPGRGHLRPPRARRPVVPGAPRAARRAAPARAAATDGRLRRRCAAVRTARRCRRHRPAAGLRPAARARGRRAARGPGPGPRRGAADGRPPGRPATSSTRTFTELPTLPRPRRPRRGQHLRHPPGRDRRHARPTAAARRPPLDRLDRRPLGGRAPPAAPGRATERWSGAAARPRRLPLAGGGRPAAWPSRTATAAGCGSPTLRPARSRR